MGCSSFSLGLALLLVALPYRAVVGAPQLRFERDGTFKVVQFSDLHYGEDPHLDSLSDQVQRTVLKAEKPSLVVLSGDMVSGYAWDSSAGWYAARWQQLAGAVRSTSAAYAAILGNHDGEADISRREILALDARTSNSTAQLTQQGQLDPTGTSYYLDIQDPDGQAVAARIWMLDSNDRGCGQLRAGWGCVTPSTLAWVRRTADQLPTVPSLAFIHIPVPEFMEAWNRHPTNGSKGEPVGCPLLNTHAFSTLREIGVRAIYSGHDHYNDYVGSIHGVRLAYGRKTGYGCYGPKQGTLRGGRVIVLRRGEPPSISETWIRQEDGTRADQAATPPQDKLDTLQHTCISDLGVLGWVGWGTRAARLTVGGAVAGIALVAVVTGFVVVWGGRRMWAAGRRVERELSRSVSRSCSELSVGQTESPRRAPSVASNA